METIIEIWAQVDGEKCGGEEAAGDDAVGNRKWKIENEWMMFIYDSENLECLLRMCCHVYI